VLLRNKVEVLLSDLQASMCSDNIGIFDVLVIQDVQAPLGVLGPFRILELGDLTENGDLLNQALQGADVNGEARAVGIGLDSLLLIFAELINPDGDNLLELRTSQETERSILAGTLVLCALNLLQKAVTKGITEIREFLLIGKCAQGSHNLLPVG
jgi:hypothetical protein